MKKKPNADIQHKNNIKKRVVGRPFSKGQSGNPNGRPKKSATLIDIILSKWPAEQIAEKLIEVAQEGDKTILVDIFNRIDGKPIEKTQVRTITGIPELDALTDEQLEAVENIVQGMLRNTEGDTKNATSKKRKK